MKRLASEFRKTATSLDRQQNYSFENERAYYPDNSSFVYKSIYVVADQYEDTRNFEYAGFDSEGKLYYLKEEIKLRIKITKQEIFKIGELLTMAKKVCQEEKISFQEWIKDNFDFSYETAINFMHVHEYCFGFKGIAEDLPPSILYKLSTPSFPEELRDWLFEKGNLTEITNGILVKLVNKYNEGGIKAIEEDVTEIGRGNLIRRQVNYTLDICENTFRTLENLQQKIETRGGERWKSLIPYDDQTKTQEPEAAEINTKLHTAVSSAVESLHKALLESRVILDNYIKNLKEEYFSPAIIEPVEDNFEDDTEM